MRLAESSGLIFGEPGAGKTFNSIGLAVDYAVSAGLPSDFKVLFVNFDNLPIDRASQCIDGFFPDYAKNVELINILQVGVQKKTRESKKDIFGDLGIEESIDYVASYEYIRDTAYPRIKEVVQDCDFVIVDALFPTIRNNIGLSVWLQKNPDRAGATQSDWSAITPIEERVYNMFVISAHRYKIPVITTGTMTDDYEEGIKKGRTFGCKDRVSKAASYILELVKAPPRKRTAGTTQANSIEVVCHKSDANTWKDTLVPGEKELLDILIENGAVKL